MQKAGLLRITILVLLLNLGSGKLLLAQTSNDTTGFRCKLLEVANPTTEGKVQFTQLIPTSSTNVSWDFGDGNTFTGNNPIHLYSTSAVDSFTVKLTYTLNSVNNTITHRVVANSADFFVRLDTNTNASYVRILRSSFLFDQNILTTQGNMRFEWSVNGTILPDINYPGTNNGQYPNIRYTFARSGLNTVKLRVWNATSPTKDTSFTRIINIQPNFTTKVKFTNLPNVFTPNDDNVFDFFEVSTSGLSRLVFKVFSRAGSLVYQNESTFIKWDGKNNSGQKLPEGIYYYIIEDLDGKYENAKGFVYIFRGKK